MLRLISGNLACPTIFGIFRLIDDDDQLTAVDVVRESREQGRQTRVHFGQNFLSGSSKLKLKLKPGTKRMFTSGSVFQKQKKKHLDVGRTRTYAPEGN